MLIVLWVNGSLFLALFYDPLCLAPISAFICFLVDVDPLLIALLLPGDKAPFLFPFLIYLNKLTIPNQLI